MLNAGSLYFILHTAQHILDTSEEEESNLERESTRQRKRKRNATTTPTQKTTTNRVERIITLRKCENLSENLLCVLFVPTQPTPPLEQCNGKGYLDRSIVQSLSFCKEGDLVFFFSAILHKSSYSQKTCENNITATTYQQKSLPLTHSHKQIYTYEYVFQRREEHPLSAVTSP